MLKLWRSSVCVLLGHDDQRLPSLHTAVCRRCGRDHPDAFWMNPGPNPEPLTSASFAPVSLLHEQTTPPPEALSVAEQHLLAERPQQLTAQAQRVVPPQHSVYLSDGTVIQQDEWDALLAAGRVTMLPSGRLLIEKQKK